MKASLDSVVGISQFASCQVSKDTTFFCKPSPHSSNVPQRLSFLSHPPSSHFLQYLVGICLEVRRQDGKGESKRTQGPAMFAWVLRWRSKNFLSFLTHRSSRLPALCVFSDSPSLFISLELFFLFFFLTQFIFFLSRFQSLVDFLRFKK